MSSASIRDSDNCQNICAPHQKCQAKDRIRRVRFLTWRDPNRPILKGTSHPENPKILQILIQTYFIPDSPATSQNLPRSPPTISYLFPLACTHLHVAVDAQNDRGEPPARLAQRPVVRSAVE